MTGFGVALHPVNLLWALLGSVLGTAIGVLPGIGPALTIALLLPVTVQIAPTAAFIMFAGVLYGAMYGGSTTSILLNTPGESGSMMTALEGNKMAKAGRGAAALATAAIGSFVAGTLATLGITFFAPLVAELDRLIIVTETTIPAIKSAKQRFDDATAIRQTDKGIVVLANREKRRFLSRELTRSDIVEGLGKNEVSFLPEDRALITEALNRGILPVQARASAPFNKEIRRLVRKLRGKE